MIRLRSFLLVALLHLIAPHASLLHAADDASRYYEDALTRFERKDDAGAIIQLQNALKADPGFLAAHLLLGRASMRKGDYPAAEVALRQALKLGVSRAEVVVPLGTLLLDTGRAKEFLDTTNPAEFAAATRLEVLLLRARAQIDLRQYPAARASLDEAQRLDPASVRVVVMMARGALESGDLEEANRLAEQATRRWSSDSSAWLTKASVSYARGELVAAVAHYDRAISADRENVEALLGKGSALLDLGKREESRAVLEELAKVDSREPRAAYLRSVIAQMDGDTVTARKLLTEVVNLIDPAPRQLLAGKSNLALIAGLAHFDLGAREKAKEYLELYLRLHPGQNGGRKPLAAIYIDEGDAARALSLLEPAFRDDHADVSALNLMAAAHSKLKRHQKATEFLERAARISDDASMKTSLGLSMIGAGQVPEGVAQLESALRKNPSDLRASTALVLQSMRSGDPGKAVSLMEAAIKRDPENLSALHLLGVARSAAGDLPGARAAYERVLSKDPAFYAARLNLAKLDVSSGKFDSARSRLDQMLKENPDDTFAMYELGMLDARQRRGADAIKVLERVRTKDPRHVESQLALIDLYLAAGEPDKAGNVAKDLVRAVPGRLDLQLAVARTEIARRDPAAAKATLTTISRNAGFNAPMLVRTAGLQLAIGHTAGASYSLEKALHADSKSVPVRLAMAEVELVSGNLAKSEEILRQVLKERPEDALARRLLGDVAVSRGQLPEAVQHYQAALSRSSDFETLRRLYSVHVASRHPEVGLKLLDDWVRRNPQVAAAKILLAEAQQASGQSKAARATLEALVAQEENPVALNNLANLLASAKDPSAIPVAERALKQAPGDPVILDTLGWLLVSQGKVDPGLKHLREARLREPGNPEIRYHLAAALAKSGRAAEARLELEAALSTTDAFAGRDAATDLLRSLSGRR